MLSIFKSRKKKPTLQYVAIPVIGYEALASEERRQHIDAMTRDGWEFCFRGYDHIVMSRKTFETFPEAVNGRIYGVRGVQEISEAQADRLLEMNRAAYAHAPAHPSTVVEMEMRRLFQEFIEERQLHSATALMTLLRKKAAEGIHVTMDDITSAEFLRIGDAKAMFGDSIEEVLAFQNRQAAKATGQK